MARQSDGWFRAGVPGLIMPRHGDIAVTAALPYFEQWWLTELNANIPGGGANTQFGIGSFALPWPGYAFAEMSVQCAILGADGYQHIQASFLGSTPGPTNHTLINRHAQNQAGDWNGCIPLFARFVLPTVQTVTMQVRMYGGGGAQAKIIRVAGSVRGYPS
jgi:hypothetical protein